MSTLRDHGVMSDRVTTDPELDAPILVELRTRMEAADDPVERAVLRLRQGLYLARTHRIDEARAMPAETREAWHGREHLRVFIWLWLLEGVLDFYATSRTGQRQRLLQAHAAARKVALPAEAELAAAWLAHFAYVDNDYAGQLRWFDQCALGTARLDETSARSSLTLACALQWFGEDALAATWFGRARESARRCGDRAGIMAAGANRVFLQLAENWQRFCFGEPPRHAPDTLRHEMRGILGYEQLSGAASLQEQNEVAQLRLAVLGGDLAAARAQAGAMDAARERHSAPSLALAAVTQTWIERAELAPAVLAERLPALEEQLALAGLDDDDVAGAWALLATCAATAGTAAHAEQLRSRATEARLRSQRARDPWRAALLEQEAAASSAWALTA